jgi:hypothetical protein
MLSEAPFWERQKGDGPITRVLESQRRLHELLALRVTECAVQEVKAVPKTKKEPTAQELKAEAESRARQLELERDRSIKVVRRPAEPHKVHHTANIEPTHDAVSMLRNSYSLHGGLRVAVWDEGWWPE